MPAVSDREEEGGTMAVPSSNGSDSYAPTQRADAPENDVEKKAEQGGDEPPTSNDAPPVLGKPANGDPAPDGGTRAWLDILGVWCIAFCSFGWLNSVGVFQEYYESTILREFSDSTVSWIPSLQVFFMMSLGPIIGMLYDRYGPRYLILGGSFLHVFGLMMASLSTKYYQLLLSQGVCSAIGVGAIFQPGINTIPGWFDKKRGAAYGAVAVGSSVGGVIFPIMLARLIPKVGFPWAMRTSAFLILALLIVANLTVRARHPPQPRPVTRQQLIKPWTEVPFLLLCSGLFLFTFGMYVPINYIAAEAAQKGMPIHLVEYLVPILNAGSLFGRVGSGIISDKVGRYNVFFVVCTLTGILTLALWIPAANNAARIAFAALFGFSSGAYVALIGALVVQISPFTEIGFRTGLVFAVLSISGLTTSPISGAILSSSGGWTAPKIFSGVFCLAGSALILLTRIRETGFKLAVKF